MEPTGSRAHSRLLCLAAFVSFVLPAFIAAGEEAAIYQVVDTEASPGQEGVLVPLAASFPQPAQGFSMVIANSCHTCSVVSWQTDETVTEGADFVSVQEDKESSTLVVGLLMDTEPPFNGATIAPSTKPQIVLYLVFDIAPETLKRKYRLGFVGGGTKWGNAWVFNAYSAFNQSFPVTGLRDGNLIIGDKPQNGLPLFIRGDGNQDLQLDIADAIAILDFLYKPQVTSSCLDACDVNDDGKIDLSDPIFLLSFLFADGPYPPDPLFEPGLDWTPDPLDCEEPAAGWLIHFWPE